MLIDLELFNKVFELHTHYFTHVSILLYPGTFPDIAATAELFILHRLCTTFCLLHHNRQVERPHMV